MTRTLTLPRGLVRRAFIPAALALPLFAGPALAEELRPEVLDNLRKATFEVVLEKPAKDPLRYEKELPYDLLPFRERNDKYESIGTAFALGNGQYVSAAHVVAIASPGVRNSIHLRDAEGRIVDLDRIIKFSGHRDFVVFTVAGYRPRGELQTQPSARKNDAVFAVGNALGQGVIARDGLYTSDTPEEEKGRWQWMRFSAAASPGNSGGPLVDRDGRVVGVVLRKSENENLNYALPITEVLNASDRKGELQERSTYKLDITDRTLTSNLDIAIDLPAPYVRFGADLQARYAEFLTASAKNFMATHKADMFPQSEGAQALLYKTGLEASFPNLLSKQDDGSWDAMVPSDRKSAEVGRNGFVRFGSMGNYMFLRMQAPDDVAPARFYGDSSVFMDLLLKGIYYSRQVGPERIRITSLGAARETAVHVDAYGRKWQVRRWDVPFSRQTVVVYALPVPGGYVAMVNSAAEGLSAMYEIDMKILTDFAFVTYYGTLKQWQDFLERKDLLPAAFASISLEPVYGKEMRYRSERMSFSYPDSLMKVTPTSDLQLRFSFFMENGRVVWDVSSIVAGEDKDNNSFVQYARYARPPETLRDEDRSTWKSLANARVPYNASAVFDKAKTVIATALAAGGQPSSPKAPVLYSVVYGVEGTVEAAKMSERLGQFRAGFEASGR